MNWREQPPPARTQRRTHRDLAAAGLGAAHQQAGEIHARDEQHQPYAGLQQPEGAPRRTDDLVQHRFHLHDVSAGGEHMSARARALTPARHKRRQLRLGLFRGSRRSSNVPKTERK